MVQEQLKKPLQQVNDIREKLQAQVNTRWGRANEELRRVLTELGAEPAEDQKLGDIIQQIREKNPSFRELMLSLDAATYDTRKKASWDAHMISAYLWQKAGDAYQNDLRPLVDNYREQAEGRLQDLIEQAHKLRARVAPEKGAKTEETASE